MNKILKHFMVCVGKLHYKGNKCVGVEVVFSPTYNPEQLEAVYVNIDGVTLRIPEIFLEPSLVEFITREFQSIQNFQDLLVQYVRSVLK